MTWQAYQAQQAMAISEGKQVESIHDIVEQCVQAFNGPAKREEIASVVAVHTGISLDEVKANISHSLSKLSREGKVHSPERGYWEHL